MTWFAIPGPRPQAYRLGPEDLPHLLGVAGPSVVLEPEARRAIVRECLWRGAEDGCEVGGGLFGRVDGNTIIVESASTGPELERSPTGLHLSEGAFFAFDGRECGSWHTHPLAAFAAPSSADIASWKTRRTRLMARRYLGLIVVKGERSWARPEIAAWTVDETTAAPQRIPVIESQGGTPCRP